MKPQYHILIVDDGPQNRLYFAKEIQTLLPSCQITEAENGQEAVDLCQTRLSAKLPQYDLIIMDYQMPILNGAEATLSIRELEKQFHTARPSIIITWSSAKIAAYPLADDVLGKYFDRNELRTLLRCYHF